MKLPTLLSLFLCAALLAGSFAAGLILLHPAPGAANQEAGANPSPAEAPPEPKSADPVKAGPVPQRAARQGVKQAAEGLNPLLRPQPSGRQLNFMEAAKIQEDVGRRVSWLCQAVHSEPRGGGTQHIFFGQDSTGEFSFAAVFVAEESAPYEESPVRTLLDGLRERYMQERRKQHQEEYLRRAEARKREMDEVRKGGAAATRKQIEVIRKRVEEASQPDKIAEILAKHKKKGAGQFPINVTVTGTINRFETLILLGAGEAYCVPVLSDVKVAAAP
jgi:hypothetical protein